MSAPKFNRRTAEARRTLLVEATLRCLARHGPDGLSTRVIAAEAQVSLGLINHYFRNKDDLIAEAYASAAGELLEGLRREVETVSADDPRGRLSAFIRGSFSGQVLNPDLFRIWLAFWSLSTRAPRIQEAHDESYGAYRALLETLLGALADLPGAPRFDPRLAAIGLSALLDGLWLEWCLNATTFTPAEGITLSERWVDGLLLGPADPPPEGHC